MAGILNCCTWLGNYGSNQCEVSTPGVGACGILFCRPEVNIVTVPPDPAVPELSGVIQSITKSGLTIGRFVTVATNGAGETLLTVTGTETVNDNGGKTRNETLVGQGSLTPQDMCFLGSFLNQEVVYIAPLNNGKIGVWGHDGGLRLTEWGYALGQANDDFIGTNFTFTNSSRQLMKFIELSIDATYANYDELVVALTTT